MVVGDSDATQKTSFPIFQFFGSSTKQHYTKVSGSELPTSSLTKRFFLFSFYLGNLRPQSLFRDEGGVGLPEG